VLKALLVLQVFREHRVHKVLKAHKVVEVFKEHKVLRVLLVRRA
jgi:hypothetical protein